MIDVMPDHVQAQDACVAQFSLDGHDCFIVPHGASETLHGFRIVGSVTLGKRRYAICSNQNIIFYHNRFCRRRFNDTC